MTNPPKKKWWGVWVEYGSSESDMAIFWGPAVWERSLESGGVFTHSMAVSLLSHAHCCQCRGSMG